MEEKLEEKRVIRKSSPPIKVYCLPEERALIEKTAAAAGLSVARYLRTIGQGYEVRGILDYKCVRDLAKINGDLGRLGGLLKLWLTDDARTANFSRETILALLNRIETNQEETAKIMKNVMRPRDD